MWPQAPFGPDAVKSPPEKSFMQSQAGEGLQLSRLPVYVHGVMCLNDLLR